MKKRVETSNRTFGQRLSAASRSLVVISAIVILASMTHANEFGHGAFIVGSFVIAILCVLNILYQRTKNKIFLVSYGLINALVVIGFGLINGFWNHAFKVFLYYLHNNSLPPFLAQLFMTPQIGSFFYEGAGVLTFVLSVVAVYYGHAVIKEGRTNV